METFAYLYIVWSAILFGIIAMEEVLTRKRIETSERHSRFLPGFSGVLYGRITHHSNA
jgi:hypothetical protein